MNAEYSYPAYFPCTARRLAWSQRQALPQLFVFIPTASETFICQVWNTEENVTHLTYFSLPFKDKTVEKKLPKCFSQLVISSSNLQIKRLDHKKIKSSLWKTEHPLHMQVIKTSEKKNHLSSFPQTSGCFFWETNVHWIGSGRCFSTYITI